VEATKHRGKLAQFGLTLSNPWAQVRSGQPA